MAGSTLSEIATPEITELAPLIVLLPMIAFAVILFLGRVFNGNPTWKNTVKEGGIIALGVMGAVLVLSLLLIADFIGSVQAGHDSVFHMVEYCNLGRGSIDNTNLFRFWNLHRSHHRNVAIRCSIPMFLNQYLCDWIHEYRSYKR